MHDWELAEEHLGVFLRGEKTIGAGTAGTFGSYRPFSTGCPSQLSNPDPAAVQPNCSFCHRVINHTTHGVITQPV